MKLVYFGYIINDGFINNGCVLNLDFISKLDNFLLDKVCQKFYQLSFDKIFDKIHSTEYDIRSCDDSSEELYLFINILNYYISEKYNTKKIYVHSNYDSIIFGINITGQNLELIIQLCSDNNLHKIIRDLFNNEQVVIH